MKWTVVWLPEAKKDLALLWMHATNRNRITSAANYIDKRLARSPTIEGESRGDGQRLLIVPPLAVIYTASMEDCLVTIRAVWQFA